MIGRMLGMLVVAATAVAGTAAAQGAGSGAGTPAMSATLPIPAVADLPVCPGPESMLAPDGSRPLPAPGPLVVSGVAALGSVLDGSDEPRTARAGGALATLGTPGSSGTALLTAQPGHAALATIAPTVAGPVALLAQPGSSVPAVSAVQATLAKGADRRGLVALACPQAATDQWLVGGGTQVGERARLLLANPTSGTAVVDLSIRGPQGPVDLASATGIALPAGGAKAVYLDALAPGLPAMAVRVRARTGRVVAVLNDTLSRGLSAGGAEDIVAAAPAAAHLVVPGLSIIGALTPGGGPRVQPADPRAPGATAVRVAVPGTGPAVVRVHLIGVNGEVDLPGGGVVTVRPGGVAEVPVTGVAPGVYAAVVDADEPVVAAAMLGRGWADAGTVAAALGTPPGPGAAAGSPPGAGGAAAAGTAGVAGHNADFGWTAAAAPLHGTSLVALPAWPGPGGVISRLASTLVLTAPAAAGAVDLAEVGADGVVGAAQRVQVAAGHTVPVPVTDASALVIRPVDGSGPVIGAVAISVGDPAGQLISVVGIRAASVRSGPAPRVDADPWLGMP